MNWHEGWLYSDKVVIVMNIQQIISRLKENMYCLIFHIYEFMTLVVSMSSRVRVADWTELHF